MSESKELELAQLRGKFESSSSFLSQLDQFNTNLVRSFDHLNTILDLFTTWTPELKSCIQLVSSFFDIAVPENKDSTVKSVNEYYKFAEQLSQSVSSNTSRMVGDKFTTDQIRQLRELFNWFADVSKCYNQFHPNSTFLMSQPHQRLQESLDRRFSDIIMKLSEDFDSSPADLMTLGLLPPSFPTHLFAFSNLLYKITDIHQHLIYTEISYIAQQDNIEIMKHFPPPCVLKGFAPFQKACKFQNGLIKEINRFRKIQEEHFTTINEVENQLTNVSTKYEHFTKVDFVDYLIQSREIMNQTIQALSKLKYLQLIEKEKENVKPIQYFTQNFNFNTNLPPLNENLDEYISELLKYQEEIGKVRFRFQTENSLLKRQKAKDADKLPDVDQVSQLYNEFESTKNSLQEVSEQTCDVVKKMIEINKDFTEIARRITSKGQIMLQSSLMPAHDNLCQISSFLTTKIEEKKKANSEYLRQMADYRYSIDKMQSVIDTIKYQQKYPEMCPACVENRTIVLTSCGHTYCDNCFERIVASKTNACPICQIPFTSNDVLRIAWD